VFPDHPAGSLCGLSAEWHDPPRWRVDDVLDLLRQSLERDAHLLLVFVPVVDAADAADRMAEAPLRGVGIDTRAAQQRPGGPAQIMECPALDAARLCRICISLSPGALYHR
jgi:hypothetical protein